MQGIVCPQALAQAHPLAGKHAVHGFRRAFEQGLELAPTGDDIVPGKNFSEEKDGMDLGHGRLRLWGA
jgi:hypothetical protein